MINNADIIAKRLYQTGCRHAFGIPGGEVLTLMAALENAGIAFHLVKHENNGGFMAEGTHHASGGPGVLMATVGPGCGQRYQYGYQCLAGSSPTNFPHWLHRLRRHTLLHASNF